MKKTLLFLLATLAVVSFKSPKGVVGKMFPAIECEDYNGKKVKLPDVAQGKYTLVGMAFSNAAEKDLKTWIDPVYAAFVPKQKDKEDEDNPFDISSMMSDVNLYFVPMFTKANQLLSKSAKEKIKQQSSPELYPYLLFYEGSKTYKEELDFEKKDVPYLFVLDESGKIKYATSGEFNSKKLDAIIDAITD
jgi:hypothetical protein